MNVYPRTRTRTESESSSEYSDESCDSSCSCDQHSESSCDSVAAWENDIEPNGELFYIKYSKYTIKRDPSTHNKRDEDVSSNNVKKGKIARLIHRRRNNAKRQNDTKKDNKVTFLYSQQGETKEVILKLENDAQNRTIGRRYKFSEYLLGVSTCVFENTDRVMISGFVGNVDTERQNIKIGDWLKEINGISITPTNLDTVLRAIKLPADVKLTLQRTSVIEDPLIDNSIILDKCDWFKLSSTSSSLVGVLFLNTTNGNDEHNISYCYPSSCDDTNIYYRIKGTFLTLNHLLPNIVSVSPQSSTLIIGNEMVHVTYVVEESGLLIIAMPTHRCNLLCLNRLTTKLVKYLKFLYHTLTSCFTDTSNHVYLNNLFVRILQNDLNSFNDFEYLFTYPRWWTLPHDIQMRIDDLLYEFEANDFGDLSEDHFGFQRHYTIISCCLYQKGILIASHMNVSDQSEVNIFCHMYGLLRNEETIHIHSLVVWREVHPSSMYDMSNNAIFNDRRWFLMIVGQGPNVLTALLESGGSSIKAIGNPGPDNLYVEELQELLHNIQTVGINHVAERLLSLNTNFKEVDGKACSSKPSSWKSAESLTNFMLNTTGINSRKKMSILKNKEAVDTTSSIYHSSPMLSVIDGGDNMSDSLSRTTSSILSDELTTPVVGRRTERQRQAITKLQSTSIPSLSDSENSVACSLTDTIGKAQGVKDLKMPNKISENVLLYYLDMDKHKGVMMYPNLHVNDNINYKEVISNFKNTIQHISQLFLNTIEKSCDLKSSSVKEFGVLFESEKPSEGISTYWVVGRLFNWPYSREVYVCYEDSIPQNMVEIAFNFALSN